MSVMTLQHLPPEFALPFSPASFVRVANAARRQLGLLVAFSPPRMKRVDGFTVAKSRINNSRHAIAWITALSKSAPAHCLEISAAPTPEAAAIGMQAWRIALEVIHTEASAEQKVEAFGKLTNGIKPGGTLDLDFDGVHYRLEWIPDTVLQLVASRRAKSLKSSPQPLWPTLEKWKWEPERA